MALAVQPLFDERAGEALDFDGIERFAEDQQALAKRYGEIFDVFAKHKKSIARVTFWGLRDADSWRRNNHPLVFDDDYGRKPAYDAVIQSAKKAEL